MEAATVAEAFTPRGIELRAAAKVEHVVAAFTSAPAKIPVWNIIVTPASPVLPLSVVAYIAETGAGRGSTLPPAPHAPARLLLQEPSCGSDSRRLWLHSEPGVVAPDGGSGGGP